jgi:ATP-dependent DNA helicase RecG
MPGEIDVLRNVLELEKKKKFNNTAVAGGLLNFRNYLEKLAGFSLLSSDIFIKMSEVFILYEGMNPEERESAINGILGLIPPRPDSTPTNIKTSSFQKVSEKSGINQIQIITQDKALYADIQSLIGIGQNNSKLYYKLGINTVYDLLRYYPRRYQDYSQLKPINKLNFGDELTVIGTITQELSTRTTKNGRLKISETAISDGTGTLRIIWFNKPFLSRQLYRGVSIVVSGKIDVYLGRLLINNPEWELLDKEQLHTNRIVPIYPLTSGITQRMLRKTINHNLVFWSKRVKEYLPADLVSEEKLPLITEAISQIHFPDTEEKLANAKKRFAFEEIFFLQLGVILQKRNWIRATAKKYPLSEGNKSKISLSLPYKLTKAQENAVTDITNDLMLGYPMNRLLQGDVGSGKTIVARFAIEAIIANGAQAAVLSPTSILAEQHFRTISALLTASGSAKKDEVALLIGSTPQKERKVLLEKLSSGQIKVIIGTHALLEDPVIFNDLQLAVIDEQHRFGVEQRNLLKKKGASPHLLVMTATPIPRSLALTIYGDLEVSVIDEMPVGRKPVETLLLQPGERKKAYELIRSQINNGFQAFIVYPLIEGEEEDDDFKAAVNEHERISRSIFPDLKVGLMHGKLKPAEKDKVMKAFRNHEFDILVSTTVIEVGVDIPNAVIVLIEGADHFGLAQLHQIRGRVGRNSEKSYCLLIPEDESGVENERLKAMIKSNDGFELADLDLKQRGPGEFLGTRQAGFVPLRFANITDLPMIERCRNHAQRIFSDDPDLDKPDYQLLYQELKLHWPQIKIN